MKTKVLKLIAALALPAALLVVLQAHKSSVEERARVEDYEKRKSVFRDACARIEPAQSLSSRASAQDFKQLLIELPDGAQTGIVAFERKDYPVPAFGLEGVSTDLTVDAVYWALRDAKAELMDYIGVAVGGRPAEWYSRVAQSKSYLPYQPSAAPAKASRYTIRVSDRSMPSERQVWVAGTRVEVIDTLVGDSIFEVSGYVWDPFRGNSEGFRQPWSWSKMYYSCPKNVNLLRAAIRALAPINQSNN